MSNYPELLLKNQLCHSIYSASNALVRSYRPLLERINLTYPQYLVMLALWEKDNVPGTDLSERTRFDAGTLTPILNRLDQKGLLTRQSSSSDVRQKLVLLTEEGRELEKMALEVPQKMACLSGMSLDEGRQLKELAEQLYSHLLNRDSK